MKVRTPLNFRMTFKSRTLYKRKQSIAKCSVFFWLKGRRYLNPKGRDRREKVRWTFEQGAVQAAVLPQARLARQNGQQRAKRVGGEAVDCMRRRRTADANGVSSCVSPFDRQIKVMFEDLNSYMTLLFSCDIIL